jgi:hypothetical protein
MRNIINVTKTINVVLGTGRDLVVVAKRNAEMLRRSVRTYLMRHAALPAHAGSWLFGQALPSERRLQPAYATATPAAAGPCRASDRVGPASSPSARVR